ncbi:MAG: acetaldehyde dehydrogenase (acetylating) [Eubacteriales bacterium]|nr:acetaldehyde dehydrogenase (acetylating) [Eubacteriales bacterium]
MQLYDKDLLSVQEVRDLVSKAVAAQQELAQKSQEEVDAIVRSIAYAGVRNAQRLAKMAHEETGFGKAADKVIKNVFGSLSVYEAIKDMKTVGVIDEDKEKKTKTIAVPVGVVAGLIPSTNPTSTTFFKSEIALKAGNAIIFSPHPNAKESIVETVKVIRTAIAEAGGNEDLVAVITNPTIQATDVLMKHPMVNMILATGGSAMVRAAYSSGTPAIGVGPGNGPAYIDESADVALAVKRIFDSKTFDNGTICSSEQSVMCTYDMEPIVRAEMEKQGACFLNDAQIARLGKFILRANGTMNPQIVGRSAKDIAALAGIEIPDGTRVLVARENGIGFGHPYSNEKLCPILGFFTGKDYKELCDLACKILLYEGKGHTFSMHAKNQEVIDYFAKRVPVSRVMVNTPSALGGIGGSTGMQPSLTLGCGAIGGSATSENVGPQHLINVKVVAEGLHELDDIRKTVDQEVAAPCCCSTVKASDINIDDLVMEIVKRLQEI